MCGVSVGMGVVGGLVAVYLLRREDPANPDRSYAPVALVLAAVVAVAVSPRPARCFGRRSRCPCCPGVDAGERAFPARTGGAGAAWCPVGGRHGGLARRIRPVRTGDLRHLQQEGVGLPRALRLRRQVPVRKSGGSPSTSSPEGRRIGRASVFSSPSRCCRQSSSSVASCRSSTTSASCSG